MAKYLRVSKRIHPITGWEVESPVLPETPYDAFDTYFSVSMCKVQTYLDQIISPVFYDN